MKHRLAEIAFLVGHADRSHFTPAFRRWRSFGLIGIYVSQAFALPDRD